MLEQMGKAAKAASYQLALLSSREKNRVLEKIADYLEAQSEAILLANEQDLQEASGTLCRNGFDRVVPVGQALVFSPVWDGYVLLGELTRRITITLDMQT